MPPRLSIQMTWAYPGVTAFSGVDDTSEWLQKDDLLALVRDIGFSRIDVFRDVVERNGPRIGLLARR